MLTVSARDFRTNQKSYLDRAAQGDEVLIMRHNEAFKLTKVTNDDTLMSKEEFFAKIGRAVADADAGRTYKMHAGESLDAFMERMETEGNV